MPFFTIIIPTYNRAELIIPTIDSVSNQDFTDWECIIVDDGSTDNTKEIVESLALIDNRIKYIYQKNSERCVARNNGIKNAKGDYICFLDSDDLYHKNHLSNLYEKICKLNHPIAMCFTNYLIAKNNKIIEPKISKLSNDLINYIAYNPIIPSRVCIHKEILETERFEVDILNGEDTLLWFKIALIHPIFHFENPTVIYSLHSDNSVNIANGGGIRRLKGFKLFFDRYPKIKKEIPKYIRCFLFGDTHFSIAKYYLYNNKKRSAIKHILLSIIYQKKHPQLKHKVYILFNLLINKENPEYQKLKQNT
jgi:glycosyltransferase involved in cell wall biosynthesis